MTKILYHILVILFHDNDMDHKIGLDIFALNKVFMISKCLIP